ncbi:MAG: hypothetical protein HBSIN02_15750 [Bacteroidia bacterium]|nr:MAG: hypothetical protein HBSIN02_15750 [Bacteroidia bacterium]
MSAGPEPMRPSSWWHFYFRPVLSARSLWSRLPPTSPPLAPALCFFIFCAAVGGLVYWLLSDESYLRAIIGKARAASSSDFSLAEEAMERAMRNPALKLYVSLDAVFKRARSLLSFLVAALLTLRILSGKGALKEYLLSASLSTSVLLFGVVLQAIVMYVLRVEGFTPSLMALISPGPLLKPAAEFLKGMDIFTVWFLGTLAARLTHVSSEPFHVVLIVVLAVWLIVFSTTILLNGSFLFLL